MVPSGLKRLLFVGLLATASYLLLVSAPAPYRVVVPHGVQAMFSVAYACPPPCNGSETEAQRWCPNPVTGPCTEYECEFKGGFETRCEFQVWPPNDPDCAGCRNDRDVDCEAFGGPLP